MKILKFIVEGIYWLNIFLAIFLILSGLGYTLYYYVGNSTGFIFFVVLAIAGFIIGIYCAEKARRKISCSVLVNNIFSSRDIKG